MADPEGSDKFLLERLNALKPTSINLDPSSKSIPTSTTIEKAKPPSKEDALSDRLKSLRNQIDSRSPSSPGAGLHQSHSDDAVIPSAAGTKPTQPQTSSIHYDARLDPDVSRSPTTGVEAREDVDPLLDTDDQTLEELLADLGSDQAWLDEVAAQEEEEHRRVTALLEELGKTSTSDPQQGDTAPHEARRKSPRGESDDDSDDDSEGDQMTRESDDVLAKALDEVELEQSHQPAAPASASATSPTDNQKPHTSDRIPSNHQPGEPSDSFKLPAVPSQLQDQLDDDLSDTDADFEATIASRMAVLKVSSPKNPMLPSVPASDVNILGLPGAPTFSPHDRPVPGLIKRPGFTDEDQKSWCIVCLEDGAIRCLGCEAGDNIYCARCWKEMHVGPRAGYEERGHGWEKYVRER